MFSRIWTKPYTKSCSEQIERLKAALQDCDAVVIGAGAGLSTSAGFVYTGDPSSIFVSKTEHRSKSPGFSIKKILSILFCSKQVYEDGEEIMPAFPFSD